MLKMSDIPRDNLEILQEQIKIRRKMVNDCVGWLYQSILMSEIAELLTDLDARRWAK